MEPQGNPYRIAKPTDGILWNGTFWGSNDSYRAVLTTQYLWLWKELAIPLVSIKKVILTENGRTMRIIFHQGLIHQDLAIELFMVDFFSRRDQRRLAEAWAVIHKAWSATLTPAPENSMPQGLKSLLSQASCEVCGNPKAALLESGYHISFGILFSPIDVAKWVPVRPYVCTRHAIAVTCRNNLITSLTGYFGIPAIFTGPYHVWRNALRLRQVYSVSPAVALCAGICGMLLPLTVITLLYRWLATR